MIAIAEPQLSQCGIEAVRHFDEGRKPVPCDGKRPRGRDWANGWQHRDRLIANYTRHPADLLGLIFDGTLVDFEADSPEQAVIFKDLFGGDVPRTVSYRSPRGEHNIFQGDHRLNALGVGVLNYLGLGIRIGGGGKAVQSVIPPSDGRQWINSFYDCDPAPIPDFVVARIIEHIKPMAVKTSPPPAGVIGLTNSSIAMAVAAMLRLNIAHTNDGSKDLYARACRTVEHDLSDSDAILAIRESEKTKPFPREWSDADILARLRDAEKATTRGARGEN